MRVVCVIPARLASTRLPAKPLCEIGGVPMVVRVWERARLARTPERVIVATDAEAIAAVVRAAGGEARLTRSDHPSGTDRVHEALCGIDADVVVNVQGDEPFLASALVDRLALAAASPGVDLATAAAPLRASGLPPSVVRVQVDGAGRALRFARRDLPGRCLHHVGVYAFRRAVLEAFTALPPSEGERRERLEQLRLLDNGYRISVLEIDEVPLAVDTPADLEAARVRWAVTGGR